MTFVTRRLAVDVQWWRISSDQAGRCVRVWYSGVQFRRDEVGATRRANGSGIPMPDILVDWLIQVGLIVRLRCTLRVVYRYSTDHYTSLLIDDTATDRRWTRLVSSLGGRMRIYDPSCPERDRLDFSCRRRHPLGPVYQLRGPVATRSAARLVGLVGREGTMTQTVCV